MEMVVVPFLQILAALVSLYTWVVILNVVFSWLTAFKVINTSNRFIYLVMDFAYRATEPALRRIRRFVPNLGGMDISPILLIALCWFIERILLNVARQMQYG